MSSHVHSNVDKKSFSVCSRLNPLKQSFEMLQQKNMMRKKELELTLDDQHSQTFAELEMTAKCAK